MDTELIQSLQAWLLPIVPLAVVIVVGSLFVFALRRHFTRSELRHKNNFKYTLILLSAVLSVLVAIVLTLPIGEEMRKQLLALLGLVLTLMMAFSSTSVVANAVAGLMLRGVDNMRAGDFIHVGEQFGRVTERGLFHTEIQTQERDLTTIPNLYLVSHPVSVVRSSGTIVSAEVSLGYDNDLDHIEKLLLEAAANTGLADAFVYVKSLGDFSIVYRVSGFLDEVKQLLTVRSTLRKNMIRTLHHADIEIVSPNFMNQRVYDAQSKVLVKSSSTASNNDELINTRSPEELIFDKAETAEKKAILEQRKKNLKEKIATLQEEMQLEDADGESIGKRIDSLEQRLAYVRKVTSRLEGDLED